MEASILLELERAELAARERKLSAEAEAERLLADARREAAEIAAGVERAIATAVEERRCGLEASADEEIAVIRAELAGLAPLPRRAADPAAEAAVTRVLAAVLDEPRS